MEIIPQALPVFRNSACSWLAASASLSTTTGIAPSEAAPRVIAAPMPFAPPVIRIILSLSCRSIGNRFQFVEARGIATENIFQARWSTGANVIFDKFHNLAVAAGKKADRPIGAEHQALRTERFADY